MCSSQQSAGEFKFTNILKRRKCQTNNPFCSCCDVCAKACAVPVLHTMTLFLKPSFFIDHAECT